MVAWLGVSAILSGCAGIDPTREYEEDLNQTDLNLPSMRGMDQAFIEQDFLTPSPVAWWTVFSEVGLERMIEATLTNSIDLGVAYTRLDEALAARRATRADLLPSVNLTGNVGVATLDLQDGGFSSGPSRTQSAGAGLVMGWQLDIFGELRSAHRSAKASLQASEQTVRDIQRIIVSQVAEGYYELASVRERIRVAKESLQRRELNQDRINQLLDKGYATTVDQARSDSQSYDSRAILLQLELDEITLLNQLSLLVGVSMNEVRDLLADNQNLAGIPAELMAPSVDSLLTNRPDLRAVERELVAAAYDVRSARRAQYPTLGLSAGLDKIPASIDAASNSLPNLNSWASDIVANLATPILGRGRILAQINTQSARLERAHLNYENALRVALQGIDTALAGVIKNRFILEQRILSRGAARKAAEQSKDLYEAGEIDYTSVIVAEQTRAFAEDSVILAHRNSLIAYIQYTSAVAPTW